MSGTRSPAGRTENAQNKRALKKIKIRNKIKGLLPIQKLDSDKAIFSKVEGLFCFNPNTLVD